MKIRNIKRNSIRINTVGISRGIKLLSGQTSDELPVSYATTRPVRRLVEKGYAELILSPGEKRYLKDRGNETKAAVVKEEAAAPVEPTVTEPVKEETEADDGQEKLLEAMKNSGNTAAMAEAAKIEAAAKKAEEEEKADESEDTQEDQESKSEEKAEETDGEGGDEPPTDEETETPEPEQEETKEEPEEEPEEEVKEEVPEEAPEDNEPEEEVIEEETTEEAPEEEIAEDSVDGAAEDLLNEQDEENTADTEEQPVEEETEENPHDVELCGYLQKRSGKPCIKEAGHSGHHRYNK